jgi:hypothetical protein
MRHLSFLTLAATLLAVAAAPAETPRGDIHTLGVRVYDLGGVDEDQLAGALRHARAIFADAGMASQWHDCTRGAKLPSGFCREPRQDRDLIVRILRRSQTDRDLPRALGVSVVESGRGVLATVFLDLIEPVARRTSTGVDVLLGRAIAHEVGHLVLGSGAHSASGLMRDIWTAHELGRNDERDWLFGPSERARLRALRLRVAAPLSAEHETRDSEATGSSGSSAR